MTTPGPGRRLYDQARALQRAKRQMLLRRTVTVVKEPAKVLQFPTTEEVGDAGPVSG